MFHKANISKLGKVNVSFSPPSGTSYMRYVLKKMSFNISGLSSGPGCARLLCILDDLGLVSL